jgi:ATP-dependent DNA ligase
MLIRNTPVTTEMLDKLQGMIAQPKIDGVRLCFMRPEEGSAEQSTLNRLRIWTRSSQKISPRLYRILDEVLPDYTGGGIVDGELVYKNDCAATTGILHSKTIAIDPEQLRFYAFDYIIPQPFSTELCDGVLESRLHTLDQLASLDAWVFSMNNIVQVLPHWQHHSAKESLGHATGYCEAWGLPLEGYVLKPRSSLYVCGRRLDGSFKYKVSEELTGVIRAVHPQVGQDHIAKDLAGIIEVQVGEGKDAAIVNVTASCDNALRAKIMERAQDIIGRTIVFRVFACPSGDTVTAALRMPRYVSGLEFLLNFK